MNASVTGARREARPSRARSPRPAPDAVEIAGIRITHPDRVMFPDVGLTKEGLARYYDAVADRLLPHLEDRPLTLVRCPGAIGDECFYMKHSKVWAPPALRRVRIKEKTKTGEYLIADSRAAVVSLVQMGVTEIHTWNARYSSLETPDRLVLDLDPGPEIEWPQVVGAARLLRSVLDAMSLRSFVKTTGGRGLHVVVPISPAPTWEAALAAAREIAEALVELDGSVFTTRFAKAGRERLILVDYLRNNRANTAVAAYSTRARPGATVSWPMRWESLSTRMPPTKHTVATVPRRLVTADPWKEFGSTAQELPPLRT